MLTSSCIVQIIYTRGELGNGKDYPGTAETLGMELGEEDQLKSGGGALQHASGGLYGKSKLEMS